MSEEIPLRAKYAIRPAVKQQKGGHNNGPVRKRVKREPVKGEKQRAQQITADPRNQRVLVLLPTMKRRLMTPAEWDEWQAFAEIDHADD